LDLLAVDLDGDGRPEIVTRVVWGIAVLTANGARRFERRGAGLCLNAVVANLDGDSHRQIVMHIADRLIAVDSRGATRFHVDAVGHAGGDALAAIDLDHDGRDEIVLTTSDSEYPGRRPVTGKFRIFEGDGSIRFEEVMTCGTSSLLAADLDGDGSPEIAVASL